MPLPRQNEIIGGFRYNGGDPNSPDGWEKITSPSPGDVMGDFEFAGGDPNSKDSWKKYDPSLIGGVSRRIGRAMSGPSTNVAPYDPEGMTTPQDPSGFASPKTTADIEAAPPASAGPKVEDAVSTKLSTHLDALKSMAVGLATDEDGRMTDARNQLASGTVSLAQQAIEFGKGAHKYMFGGNPNTVNTPEVDAFLKNANAYWQEGYSPDLKAAALKKWVDSDKGGLGAAWSDPRAYELGLVQSTPANLAMMFPPMMMAKAAYPARAAAELAIQKANGLVGPDAMIAAEKAAADSVANTAAWMGRFIEGGLGAGQSVQSVRDDIEAMPFETLNQSEAFMTLRANGLSPEQARRALAEERSGMAFILAGVTTGLFGGAGDRVLARLVTEGAEGTIVRRVLRSAVAEGLLEEFPQNLTQQMSENFAKQAADPRIGLMDDALNQAVGGAVAGGIMGGAMGGAFGHQKTPHQQIADELARNVSNSQYVVPASEVAARALDPNNAQMGVASASTTPLTGNAAEDIKAILAAPITQPVGPEAAIPADELLGVIQPLPTDQATQPLGEPAAPSQQASVETATPSDAKSLAISMYSRAEPGSQMQVAARQAALRAGVTEAELAQGVPDARALEVPAPAQVVEQAPPATAAKAAGTTAPAGGVQAEGQVAVSSPSHPLAQVTNPVDLKATPQEQVTQLQALSKQSRPLVDQVVSDINAMGIKAQANEKLPERILEKGARPSILAMKPWHTVAHVRDSLRFKAVPDSFDQLPEMLDAVKKRGFEVVKTDTAKVLQPEEWGWRIAAFDLRHPTTGQLIEFYTPVPELEAAKKARGHQLFEKWRNRDLSELTPEERAERYKDVTASNALYDGAWQAYLTRTGQDESAIRASLAKAEVSSGEALTKPGESAKSSPLASAEAGAQASEAERLKAKNPSAPSTLAQPSKPSETPTETKSAAAIAAPLEKTSNKTDTSIAKLPDDVKLSTPEERRMRNAEQRARLDKREYRRKVRVDDGRTAELVTNAARELDALDERIGAVEQLARCLA